MDPPAVTVVSASVLVTDKLAVPMAVYTVDVLLPGTVSLTPDGAVTCAVLVAADVLLVADPCTTTLQVLPPAIEATEPLSRLPANAAVHPEAPAVMLTVATVMLERLNFTRALNVKVDTYAEPLALAV